MSFETLIQAVQSRFHANWDRAAVPVTYQNVRYQPGADITEWVRLNVLPAESNNAAIGNALQRTPGVIDVQIFSREERGIQIAGGLADDVKNIFENQYFSGVQCRATSVFLSSVPRDGWLQVNVSTRFEYDVIA